MLIQPLKAFELSASHYLLKPFKVKELQLALEKYRRQRHLEHRQKKIEVFWNIISSRNPKGGWPYTLRKRLRYWKSSGL